VNSWIWVLVGIGIGIGIAGLLLALFLMRRGTLTTFVRDEAGRIVEIMERPIGVGA